MAKAYAKSFYNSTEWEACRSAYVTRRMQIDGGLCERCGREAGREVHHKTPISLDNIGDINITLNPDNLMLLCRDCHFAVHREMILAAKQASRQQVLNHGCWIGEDGQPRPMAVHIVWGAPAAGKSRYVEEHRGPLDMVVDLDAIQDALGRSDRYGDSHLLGIGLRIRSLLYHLIADRDELIDARTVWVVATLPIKDEREQLSKDLRADLIHIDATPAECRARLLADEDRPDKQLAVAVMERYFERLER